MPELVQNGVPINLLNAVAVGVLNGTGFSLPAKPGKLTWQTIYGVAPGSITINIQMSNDNTNWTTMDSSTATAGELRLIPSVAALFIRATISAVAGGTTATVILVYKGESVSEADYADGILTNVRQSGSLGAGLTVLHEIFLPANLLANNGDAIMFESWVQCAANANNKLSAIILGNAAPTTVASRSGVADNNLPRLHRGTIVRTGPATGQCWGAVDVQGGASLLAVGAPGESWALSLSLRLSAQGTADNDIVARGTRYWFVPVGGTYVGL